MPARGKKPPYPRANFQPIPAALGRCCRSPSQATLHFTRNQSSSEHGNTAWVVVGLVVLVGTTPGRLCPRSSWPIRGLALLVPKMKTLHEALSVLHACWDTPAAGPEAAGALGKHCAYCISIRTHGFGSPGAFENGPRSKFAYRPYLFSNASGWRPPILKNPLRVVSV